MVLLHGAGDLGALGIPLPVLMLLTAGAVPALAGALSARAVGMESRPAPRYRQLPRWVTGLADSRAFLGAARVATIAGLLAVIGIAAIGPEGMTGNAAPRLALIVVWGGVAAGSVALGPFWRVVSPFRALARFAGSDPEAHRPLPASLGMWPAAVSIGVWAWLAENMPSPRPVALLLIAYTAVQVTAGLRYGDEWFARGEALEALSTLLGRLSPIGRDQAGRLSVRDPLPTLGEMSAQPGLRAVIAVALAWELSHALRGTASWPNVLSALGWRPGPATATLALAVAILVAGLAVRGATPRAYLIPATVPLLAGWSLSHEVGPVLLDWRAALVDLADPLGLGWQLWDLSPPPIEPSAPGVVSLVQVVLLVTGALLSVLAGHRIAVARHDLRAARAVQFPLRVVLAAAVLAGMALAAFAAE